MPSISSAKLETATKKPAETAGGLFSGAENCKQSVEVGHGVGFAEGQHHDSLLN